MPKRVSIKGKGADIFFGGDTPPHEDDGERQDAATQDASMPESQEAGLPDVQQQTPTAPTPLPSPVATGAGLTKATYRLSLEALDALEECRRLLRREYGLKGVREEIVGAAILGAYEDLLANQQASKLVRQLSGKPAKQKAG